MELTSQIVKFSETKKPPFLAVDLEAVRKNCRRIRKNFNGAKLYYAIKANPEKKILEAVKESGCGFEVASLKELNAVLEIGAVSSAIISSNPIKTPEFVKAAYGNGLEIFVVDSEDEIEKLSKLAPRVKACIRLVVSNFGSEWPLTQKFGVEDKKVIPLLKLAKARGLIPYGITFHVGSQCLNKQNWVKAIRKCRLLFSLAEKEKINLKLLNLGGGLPIKHPRKSPSVEEVGHLVINTLKKTFKACPEITLEPGRAIVGDAGILVTSIIGKAKRGNQEWLYLDAGVFQGLMETVGGISYEVKTTKKSRRLLKYMLTGPTCDSFDKMFICYLPDNLEIGDRLYFTNAGAYTTAYASEFDGFEMPKTYFLT